MEDCTRIRKYAPHKFIEAYPKRKNVCAGICLEVEIGLGEIHKLRSEIGKCANNQKQSARIGWFARNPRRDGLGSWAETNGTC